MEPNLTDGPVSISFGAADQPMPPANRGLVDADLDGLATEIMNEARMSLMMAFRFLDTALWRMPYKMAACPMPLATNGKELFVAAVPTLVRFEQGMNEVVRDYLHTILHCVFRHPFDTDHLNIPAWSLACDIVVEAIALEMTERRFDCEYDDERRDELKLIEKKVGSLSPVKLYRVFASAEINAEHAVELGFNTAKIWDLRQLFQRDSHETWANERQKGGDTESEKDGVRQRNLSDRLQDKEDEEEEDSNETQMLDMTDDDEEERQDDQQRTDEQRDEEAPSENKDEESDQEKTIEAESDEAEKSQQKGEQGEDTQEGDSREGAGAQPDEDQPFDDVPDEERELHQKNWEEIAKQIEMDLETFNKGHDGEAGTLTANLAIANKKKANYGDFLRQFATLGEDMKINDDEFDYIYYTYGLNTFGNMPLVEPLEYQENYRVREFVIALDTSGSCSGELITQFVTRTYDILRETEGFGDKVNIHIIQCDNTIQADLKIECVEDLEKYCENFKAFGFGGTDFRPVFSYVDKLIEDGEFENLRGLIYFTDGLGYFPKNPPGYETAFVFVDDGSTAIKVPPWSMKVVLEEDEIHTL